MQVYVAVIVAVGVSGKFCSFSILMHGAFKCREVGAANVFSALVLDAHRTLGNMSPAIHPLRPLTLPTNGNGWCEREA